MIDRIQYGYDPSGNRTWRKNLAAEEGGQDNAYRHDGLYQVTESALGTLNLNQSAIGAIPSEEEAFAYDPSGNWTHFTKRADGAPVIDQSRVSNRDNQMTQIDGSSDGISYDRAGNATRLPPDADGAWDSSHRLIWDAWNRLVEVKDSTGATGAKYAYDGLHRRTKKTLGTETRHLYYNDQWKCVEERQEGVSSSSSSSSSPSSSSSGSSSTAFAQYAWGARPGHRDELILRDRDPGGSGTLTERLYATMDYFNGISILDEEGI